MTVTVSDLEKRVEALEKRLSNTDTRGPVAEVRKMRDRVEDLCDHVYGVNVRPPLRERSDDEYAAEVKPSNEDDE